MGWASGYGNFVVINHGNGYATAYGHLSRFAAGMHHGSRVRQGQVFAYSGATGLATGPHLHYEIRINNAQVNPLTVKVAEGRLLNGRELRTFLDQRLNYAAASRYAHGEALDVCTYQGGFALHLARTCSHVTGIDASRAALEVAEENLEVNLHRIQAPVEWIEANAFDLLRDWSTAGTTFDTVVLDPPAFAKSKRAVPGALRGYKELNLRALKMLRPGGTLVTCSCSHHVSWDEFHGVVADAAGDAQRRVRLLERREAAPDHPVVLNIPETEYLKCLILRVD